MKKLLMILPLALILCVMVGCQNDKNPISDSLIGTWKVVETATIEDGLEIEYSYEHPSLYFFQEGYYCMVMVQGSEPRVEYENPWDPSDEEIIQAYNSILVNAGTYELKDSIMITRPIIARVPNFVGGTASYEYRIDGDKLELTWFNEVSKTGVPHPFSGKRKFRRMLNRIQ